MFSQATGDPNPNQQHFSTEKQHPSIFVRFSGCEHKQYVKNFNEIKLERQTWYYCKRCRMHRLIQLISVDKKI